jgi:hypothetical protein
MPASYDDSQWPKVEVRWTGVVTDGELTDFLQRMDVWLRRSVPFSLLLDSRGAWGLDSAQRKRVVEAMHESSAQTGALLVQAVVLDNPIQRALYFAVLWAFPMPFPSKTFGDVEAARLWLEVQLRGKGQEPRSPVLF